MDSDDNFLITAAHRYCLERRTYASYICVDWLIKHWENIDEVTRSLIVKETREAIDKNRAGDLCDVVHWKHLLEVVTKNP